MKWKKEDLNQYVQAKEYIDTVIIPLIPFQFTDEQNIEKNAFQSEVLSILTNEIEKELTGRVMLIPNYYYIKSSDLDDESTILRGWTEEIKKQPFKHVFFLTFDSGWKKREGKLDGTLLWLPGVKSGDLHSAEMHTVIKDQVEQIGELIRSYW
ncbi:YpiF family protein [Virgibacillus sp. YIM 98842]|uniref:YpiF family protein n=1 Tax=Virgibacillus sp. YIM 98842 TaxID=2663533 RepID=UPI0013DC9357|nr:YpiF family protein [Virgibacillus sp. YIM 98842]